MFVVIAAGIKAEGTANVLVNRCIPAWRCPRSILSDSGLQVCSNISHAVYKLLGVRKIAISSYHPSGNGGMQLFEPHDGPNAGNGGQQALNQLG